MAKVAIVYVADGEYGQKGKLSQFYEGPPNQSAHGSDHGRSDITQHVSVPENFDTRAVEAVVQDNKWTKEGESDVYTQPMRDKWIHNTTQEIVYIDPNDPVNYTQGSEQDPTWNLVTGPHAVLSENAITKTNLVAQDAITNSEKAVTSARAFGERILVEFAGENARLGIQTDNMVGTVLTKMQGVQLALQAGSLNEAIARTKAIPEGDKDLKYITDVRLLAYINKTRQYLGLAPVSTLAEA